MHDKANIIHISFDGAPELFEAFQSYKVGGRCSAKVAFLVTSIDSNGISGSIEEAGPLHNGEHTPPPSDDVGAVKLEGGDEKEEKSPAMIVVGGATY
jgi:hypothetical protein